MTKRKLKNHLTDRNFNTKSIVNGSFIGVLIALTPIFFYSYVYVPESKVWETFLFTYDSGYYDDASTSVWMILTKTTPLILLFIWFFTCRHWWYHAVLVPISMYIYQLIGTVNADTQFFDNFDLLYIVPVMAVIIPSIYLIRARMFDKIHTADKTLQELEEEFMLKPTSLLGKVRQYF
ncbi:hypothetical protein [Psychroserpens jangbogonensis]|uniref:hypothetical protein n=1 Tax=Psychroserpens jangbogonensis TaxID=1484460 RepID=UPI000A846AAF|nr:hypothetical protein [Psychroserpens jangbogonensis]